MKDTTDELLGSTPVQRKKSNTPRSTAPRPGNKRKKFNKPGAKINNKTKPTQGRVVKTTTSPRPAKQNQRTKRAPARKPMAKPMTTKPIIMGSNKGKLRIIPLGGCEEVGRNMTVFEYENDIVILDMGMGFPEEDMPGIDYVIPNTAYLKGKEKNIKAVIFSHGHLDHIGAAPILLEKLGYPLVIGRPLTLSMIKHKMEDYKKGSAQKLKSLVIKDLKNTFKLGKLTSKFFQMEHSIMDAVGVILETPVNTVIHPGDWTLERDKNNKPILDYSHLAKIKGPTTLMLESLGSIDVRPSASQDKMKNNIVKLITEAPGRVIIGTFSSQIERVGWIIEQAEKLGKKVALDGYSMKMNVELAKEHGYIKAKPHTFIKVDQINNYPDNKLVIIATGSQGEGNAVLSRLIAGDHRHIQIKKSDTIVLSSSIIPGNENTIQRLKDGLYRQCDNIIHGELMDIHVSGHGNRYDIEHMIKTIKPDYYMPVYAYHYMLKESRKLALGVGMKDRNIFVPDNGSVIEADKKGVFMTKHKVPTDYIFVDGLGIGDVSHVVLRDRKMMADDGMVVVIATVARKSGKLVSSPDIISRGFIYMKENKELVESMRSKIKKIVNDANKTQIATDDSFIKNKLRNDLGQFIFQKTERRPMVLPVVIEV